MTVSTTGGDLADRLAALDRIVYLAAGRLPAPDVAMARELGERARERLGFGVEHTVVALAGPTGAGKSSLFNALIGTDVSDVGVRRPTTSKTHAAVFGPPNDGLLDWLGVQHRHLSAGPDDLVGLVLLDLPDHDSTEETHRLEVDRLVELVDLLVWVSDPQKYADLALHDRYVRPLADHGGVMRFVLNKTDALDDAMPVITDLTRRLVDDGIEMPQVMPLSLTAATGLDAVRAQLVDAVARRRAAADRVAADLAAVANRLALLTGGNGENGRDRGGDHAIDAATRSASIAGLAIAAGVDDAVAIAERQHLWDARAATFWPPVRMLRRFRRQPIAEVGLPAESPVAAAQVATVLRSTAEAAAEGLPAHWAAALRSTLEGRRSALLTALGRDVVGAVRERRPSPRWWRWAATVQRLTVVSVIVGFGWLLVTAIGGGFLQLDLDPITPDTPDVGWLPLPTALLLGGLLAAVVVGYLSRAAAAMGARRDGRRVRAELERRVGRIVDERVIAPTEELLASRREIVTLLDVLRGAD